MDEALRGLAELPSVERCLLLALETVHAVTTGQEADAGRKARAAAELAHELDDPTGEAGALLARCWTLVGTPCPHELSEAGDGATALTVLPEAGILVRELLLPLRPVPALQLADRTRFAAIRDRVASLPETRGSVHAAGCVHAWDAAIALCEGRLDDAARLAGSNPGAADGVIWQSVTQFQVTVTWIERGHPAEVAVWLAQHLAVAPDAIAVRAMLALLHAEAGEATRASREVEVLRRQRPFDQLGWSAPIVLRQLAEVAARLDDRGLAADLLPVVTDYSGQLLVSYAGATVEAAADRPIGQLLLVLGRVDEAVERLAAAQALEEAFGAGLLATRTAFWQARARFKRSAAGDHATAGRLLDQAASAARRMGTGQLLRDIEALRPGATS